MMLRLILAALLLVPVAAAQAAEDWPADWFKGWEDRFSLHGQITSILQTHPDFPAKYTGPQSMRPTGDTRDTTSMTLFMGARLWPGAAIYYDFELYHGFGFDKTLGVAGFPNGEATKAGDKGFLSGAARYFLRQVIGFGGPQEEIAADANQLPERVDISRLTITVGKFAAGDIFDDNTYAHDPRKEFWNWSLWESAAWDFPANVRGYTRGLALDLNQQDWALRYGALMLPDQPNGNVLPFRGIYNLSHVIEYERRYQLLDRPGVSRFLVFANVGRMAYFHDAFRDLPGVGGDINAAIVAERGYGHQKYGIAYNGEQELSEELGAFLKLSWNDGRSETFAFTDIDRSLAAGFALKGLRWGRPDDVVGLAGAVNLLSPDHRRYFGLGGLGIVIGDGQLNYGPEGIVEAYYSARLQSWALFSVDYQLIANPAYNRDRGPVNAFGARLHLEF